MSLSMISVLLPDWAMVMPRLMAVVVFPSCGPAEVTRSLRSGLSESDTALTVCAALQVEPSSSPSMRTRNTGRRFFSSAFALAARAASTPRYHFTP